MKAGQLYRFEANHGGVSSFDGKLAVYLGEAFIHRSDGVTVENHKILMVGESTPRIIDRGILKWMCPCEGADSA